MFKNKFINNNQKKEIGLKKQQFPISLNFLISSVKGIPESNAIQAVSI